MTLLEEARELIKRYLTENPHLSTAALARSAGMPFSTARSIIQGEVQKTSLEKITSLLLVFMPFKDVMSLVDKHTEEKFWLVVKNNWSKDETKTVITSDEFEWESPDHFILAMAALPSGVTPEKLQATFGDYIVPRRVELLLDAGLVRLVNGKLKQSEEYLYYPKISDSKAKALMHLNSWTTDEIAQGGFLYHITMALSEIGKEKHRDLTRRYLDDSLKLAKEHPGDQNALLLSIVGSFLRGGE
jgi:hypothetical protein